MKVLIKFDGKVDVIENVGVDDRCLPIVAGKKPYPPSSEDGSPLMLESSLWFKTLAVDAIYIDCNRRVIHWTSLENDDCKQDVQKHTSRTSVPETTDFIPASAKPLFKDHTIYDFDASLKEMMGKCCEMARKMSKNSLSHDEYYKYIAKILHIFILPSITFTRTDMFSLSKARSLIDVRLTKVETDIKNKATVMQDIKKSLYKMEKKLLQKEKLDSENYLRTCERGFLVALLKVVESKVDNLNLKLSSVQNMVNWVKEHSDDVHRLAGLKGKRDKLFLDIDKHIQVREAIRNIIFRRQLIKRKLQKCKIVSNKIHDMFIECVRMLEMRESSLLQLASDKVNVCAAREAVLFTIAELDNSNNNSECTTRSEPETSADYSLSDIEKVKKSEVWLTFQERVTKALKDKSSMVSRCHEYGCKTLNSEIHHIMSELQVAKGETHRSNLLSEAFEEEDSSRQFSLSLDDATVGESKLNVEKHLHKNTALINKNGESHIVKALQSVTKKQKFQTQEAENMHIVMDSGDKCPAISNKTSFTDNTTINSGEATHLGDVPIIKNDSRLQRTRVNSTGDVEDEQVLSGNDNVESDNNAVFRKNESPIEKQQRIMKRELTLSMWMNSVENLKGLIQCHFAQMIKCLDEHLQKENDDTSNQEQQELLWKCYERLFCQELYLPLLELYTTGLTPGIRKAYATISRTSLHEILQEDKLLNLFFGQKIVDNRATSFTVPCNKQTRRKVSGDLCLDVQHCTISDVSSLAQDDDDVFYECFDIDGIENVEDCVRASSYDSSLSAALSIDEGFDSGSCSFSSSVPSAFSTGSIDGSNMDNLGQWKIPLRQPRVEEILYPLLFPFRRRIRKCLDAPCFLDKVRYITKATERLNKDISQMFGPDYQSVCDDIISMLVLVLCNITEDMFVGLYVNLRLLMDVLPNFLSKSLCGYILVSLCAAYDYLFTLRMCDNVVKQYPGIIHVT